MLLAHVRNTNLSGVQNLPIAQPALTRETHTRFHCTIFFRCVKSDPWRCAVVLCSVEEWFWGGQKSVAFTCILSLMSLRYGYSKMKVFNSTHLYWKQIETDTGEVGEDALLFAAVNSVCSVL